MKANLIIAFFLSLMLFALNGRAQERIIEVPMELIVGKQISIGAYPGMVKEKDESLFILPVDSARCLTGYFGITWMYEFYKQSFENDSVKREFNKFIKEKDIDTMQFVNNNLKTSRIYCCSWLDGRIKNIAFDTDGDSSFTDEKIITYNTDNGFCDLLDTNRATAVVNVMLTYDSLNIRKQKSIPVLVILNHHNCCGYNDSLAVSITNNSYRKGICTLNGVKTEIFLDAQNFDQFYFAHFNMGFYSCEYYNDKDHFGLWDTIYVFNQRYVIDKYDYSTHKIILRFDKEMKAGTQPGAYFPISPGLEEINNYTLVFFTATWCGACKNVLDSLKKFHKLVPEVEIVNINTEQDSARMNNYIKWNGIDWKVIYDQQLKGKESEYWKTYGISSIPVLLLVDYNRTVLLYGSGSGAGDGSCESVIGKILEHGPEYFDRPTQ